MSDEPNLSMTQEDVQAEVQRLLQEARKQANGDTEQVVAALVRASIAAAQQQGNEALSLALIEEALVLALPQILEEYWQE